MMGRDMNLTSGDPSSAQNSVSTGHLTSGRLLVLPLDFCVPSCHIEHCFRSMAPECGP